MKHANVFLKGARNSLAAIGVFLCINHSAFAAATISSLHAAAIFPASRDDARSFLRFHNTGAKAGKVVLIVRDSATGESLGEWTSPTIEPGTAQQFWIGTIEGALRFSSTRPTQYLIEVKSGIVGHFQHVVVNSSSSVLTNVSACSAGTTAEPQIVNGVHSSIIGGQGYPSTVMISNTSDSVANVSLGIFDAQKGTLLGTYGVASISAHAQRTVSVDAIEAQIGKPSADVTHYIVKVQAAANQSAFQGFLTHLVQNAIAGVVTDMTTTCAISPPEPIAVMRSSYENKIAAGRVIGPYEHWSDAQAFADFFQEGQYSAVSTEYTLSAPGVWPDLPGKIKFWRKVSGVWSDHTSTILKDQTGCIHSRKALVADFNGDKRPDVFFACHGHDVDPWPGEQQRMLLSKPDGSYENKAIPITAYAHGGSAADINGDGFSDVVLTDTSIRKEPFYLKNNRNGTFSEMFGRMPASAKGIQLGKLEARNIYSAELIDINADGKYDLWLAGSISADQFEMLPTVYINDGSYAFNDLGKYTYSNRNSYLETGRPPVALDVVTNGQSIYTLFATRNYDGVRIERSLYGSNQDAVVYVHNGRRGNSTQTWFPWLIEYNGSIVAADKNWPVTVPLN